ncbi:13069_t:CDS:1 [Racocetra fulgida]|uniref:13069_t:CDS:1 n=1 Tax=Racocetra fulgida TaxID=60492 RepID=A0A9N8ZTH7_9GLOM|nr:13069_t:CDS:1 [Racocetra fulgida]
MKRALWTSVACVLLVFLSMVGEIILFTMVKNDQDNSNTKFGSELSSSSFSSSSTSPKPSFALASGFALTVLSLIFTIAAIVIYWKANSMPQEDQNQKPHYGLTGVTVQMSNNQTVNNTATPYQPPQFSTPYQPPQFSNPYQ